MKISESQVLMKGIIIDIIFGMSLISFLLVTIYYLFISNDTEWIKLNHILMVTVGIISSSTVLYCTIVKKEKYQLEPEIHKFSDRVVIIEPSISLIEYFSTYEIMKDLDNFEFYHIIEYNMFSSKFKTTIYSLKKV